MKSARLLAIVLAPLATGILTDRSAQSAEPAIAVTRQAECRWAKQAPVLDGVLDDACWKSAQPITRFATFWEKKERKGTTAYLVWDDEAIYYGAVMSDAELKAYGKHRNDSLWDGDVFELFFKPRTDKPQYYEFQSNPKELVFEVFMPGRGKVTGDFAKFPRLGHKAVVKMVGTLDTPGDTDTSWTVEGRIPWTAFAPTGGKPMPGANWNFALCRYDYGPKGTEPVLMSSAPLTKMNFHWYEDYGKLTFIGPKK